MARLPARPVDELPADYCMTLVSDPCAGATDSASGSVLTIKALLGLAKAPELEAALQELLLPPPEVPSPREPATHAAQTAATEAEGEGPAEGTGGADGRGMLRRLLPRGLQVSPVPAGLEDVCSSSSKGGG